MRIRIGLDQDPLLYLAAAGLMLALVLGGGTRPGFLSDTVLQACAVPLLLFSLWRMSRGPIPRELRLAAAFCLLVVAVPLLQSVPLPPALWTALPDRQHLVESFALLGEPLPWRPLSVDPEATWLSLLSLTVPLAIFLATAQLDFAGRRWLSLLLLAIGLASVFLGLTQVAQGPRSPWRWFEFSNLTEAVGFFANRNHFAALLYSLSLFAAAWAIGIERSSAPARRFDASALVPTVASFTVLAILVAAQAVARSRAGLGLTILALVGAFLLGIRRKKEAGGFSPARLLLGAVALGSMFAVQFALYRIMERFATDPLEDARVRFAERTFEAARSFLPFGSGVGTFAGVYGLFERPQDLLANTFANRAHNDLLEVSLEAGLPGLLLMGVFAIWVVTRSIRLWRSNDYGPRAIDLALARAATLVVTLLFVHSLFDYPLRTGAMMAVFAFACGLLVAPAARAASAPVPRSRAVPEPSFPRPEQFGLGSPAARAGSRWGEGMEWPDAWRSRRGPEQKP